MDDDSVRQDQRMSCGSQSTASLFHIRNNAPNITVWFTFPFSASSDDGTSSTHSHETIKLRKTYRALLPAMGRCLRCAMRNWRSSSIFAFEELAAQRGTSTRTVKRD